MAYSKAKLWFVCYLTMTSVIFSMADEMTEILSPEEAEAIAKEHLARFQEEVEELIKVAPDDPDNDIDDPEKPRLFFLFALLPKIALVLVNLAIKAAPFVLKAVAVVKAKAVACAAAAAIAKAKIAAAATAAAAVAKAKIAAAATATIAAAKAKLSAAAAATAAKFATPAAIKHTVATGVTKLAKFAVEELVVESIQYGIESAVSSKSQNEELEKPVVDEEEPVVSSNIFDYYDNNELCKCSNKRHCSCCVEPGRGFAKACLDIQLMDTLWNENSIMKIGAFYGNRSIMIRRLPVKEPKQRCIEMQSPFDTTKMCMSVHGRSQVGNRVIQCFSLYFNQRGLTKCLVQNKKNKLWFKTN